MPPKKSRPTPARKPAAKSTGAKKADSTAPPRPRPRPRPRLGAPTGAGAVKNTIATRINTFLRTRRPNRDYMEEYERERGQNPGAGYVAELQNVDMRPDAAPPPAAAGVGGAGAPRAAGVGGAGAAPQNQFARGAEAGRAGPLGPHRHYHPSYPMPPPAVVVRDGEVALNIESRLFPGRQENTQQGASTGMFDRIRRVFGGGGARNQPAQPVNDGDRPPIDIENPASPVRAPFTPPQPPPPMMPPPPPPIYQLQNTAPPAPPPVYETQNAATGGGMVVHSDGAGPSTGVMPASGLQVDPDDSEWDTVATAYAMMEELNVPPRLVE